MYRRIFRPLLFLFSAEGIHRFSLWLISFVGGSRFGRYLLRAAFAYKDPILERDIFGVSFPNPVGIAAGFDKNGRIYRQLMAMGWGFVEIGTLTPRPQAGNARPRLFRLKADRALINRMGYDNGGLEQALYNLRHRGDRIGENVGANISKNMVTDLENATRDYLKMFRNLYQYVEYFTLNLNPLMDALRIEGRDIKSTICNMIDALVDFRRGQTDYCPILIKVSPDWSYEEVDIMIEILIETQLDGLVVGGTTLSREGLSSSPKRLVAVGEGGMSGAPLLERTIQLIDYINARKEGTYPIIASGGAMEPEDVMRLLDAGADLVELYTSVVYNGPGVIKRICKYIAEEEHRRRGDVTHS